MKSLVAYYSRTGSTKAVAEAIVDALNADVDPIIADTEGKGMGRLVMQAMLNVHARIGQTSKDVSSYDIVVVGTPVWGSKMSPQCGHILRRIKASLKASPSFVHMVAEVVRKP
ncbi:MAG: NAD(P)H-dependent oxidoreductase [Halobacteriota archaeon]